MSDCQTALFPRLEPPDLPDRCRFGQVDWSDLSPLEALVMLSCMEAQGADTVSPKADRHATMRQVLDVFRTRYIGPGQYPARLPGRPPLVAYTTGQVQAALRRLAGRRAVTIVGSNIYCQAWPVPGGAPW